MSGSDEKTEPREEDKKTEPNERPRDRRLRAALVLIGDRGRPRLSGDDYSAMSTAADFKKRLIIGGHAAFEPEQIEQPALAAFEQVVTADNGPRLSSALITVMEESVLTPGQNVASGRCS